jgi:hypothetical protein
MGGLAPVASVDGRVIGEHGIGEHGIGEHGIGEHGIGEHGIGGHATGAGPVTTQLTGLYAELTASSGTVVV